MAAFKTVQGIGTKVGWAPGLSSQECDSSV